MKFYFDVKETFIKSFAVEADTISEATAKIQQAYEQGKVVVPHNAPDDYEIVDVTEDTNDILGIYLVEEEVEIIRDLAEDSVNKVIEDCPLGGDISDDCVGCAYSDDYHYSDGECKEREVK